MAYIMHSTPPGQILHHLLELGQGVQYFTIYFTIGFTSLRPSIVQSV